MINERLIGKDLEGRGRDLTEILLVHLLEGTEKIHGKPPPE
jgi:hypothetical protein